MNTPEYSRRLAAVLVADVVGYSRMMRENELETMDLMRSLWADVFDPAVKLHSGDIAKRLGDGALVVFPSAVEAVKCALAVQLGMIARYPASDFRLRIGINIGDIIVEDGDVFGDGVNVAARLEGLSPKGGLAMSQIVHGQVEGKTPFTFECVGLRELKNIEEPVEIWAWSPKGDTTALSTQSFHLDSEDFLREMAAKKSGQTPKREGILERISPYVFAVFLLGLVSALFFSVLFFDIQRIFLAGSSIGVPNHSILSEFRDCDDCPEMVEIEGPRYQLLVGNRATNVSREVFRFSMGKYEIKNAEFVFFLNNSGMAKKGKDNWFYKHSKDVKSKITFKDGAYRVVSGFEDYPVTHVSWIGASAYVSWLSEFTGRTYRLPSKKEWNFAHLAGSPDQYFYGNGILGSCDYGNVPDRTLGDQVTDRSYLKCRDGLADIAKVGQFDPNRFNLHDTIGNVSEWTTDCYSGKKLNCDGRILMGGSFKEMSWDDKGLTGISSVTTGKYDDVGFRVLAEN